MEFIAKSTSDAPKIKKCRPN